MSYILVSHPVFDLVLRTVGFVSIVAMLAWLGRQCWKSYRNNKSGEQAARALLLQSAVADTMNSGQDEWREQAVSRIKNELAAAQNMRVMEKLGQVTEIEDSAKRYAFVGNVPAAAFYYQRAIVLAATIDLPLVEARLRYQLAKLLSAVNADGRPDIAGLEVANLQLRAAGDLLKPLVEANNEESRELLSTVHKLLVNNVETQRLSRARAYLMQGARLKTFGQDPEVAYQLLNEAYQLASNVSRGEATAAQALGEMGRLLADMGNYEEAVDTLDEAAAFAHKSSQTIQDALCKRLEEDKHIVLDQARVHEEMLLIEEIEEMFSEGKLDAVPDKLDRCSELVKNKHGADHWLAGVVSGYRGVLAFEDAKPRTALLHLRRAAMILAEWPGRADEYLHSIQGLMEVCEEEA